MTDITDTKLRAALDVWHAGMGFDLRDLAVVVSDADWVAASDILNAIFAQDGVYPEPTVPVLLVGDDQTPGTFEVMPLSVARDRYEPPA